MIKTRTALYCLAALCTTGLSWGQPNTITQKPPVPILVMNGTSTPLVPATTSNAVTAASPKVGLTFALAAVPALQMKVLVLAGDASEVSYQSITTYLTQIGVPFTGVAVDTLVPDANGNLLSGFPLSDPATGQGLYQGIIETNSTFGVCNPNCVTLLTDADFTTLNTYASQFNVRVVSYYTWPEAKWGLTPVGFGSSYTASNPLEVSLTPAGASIFSYINAANPVPVSGVGTGGIWAYEATPVAAAGETTTPILTAGSYVFGVTHTTSDGRETMSLTMDNYPTLLHSLAFSYGVINWVTRGVFLGNRRVYLNPEVDDILLGDRLYAPTLPQCPNDPSCPDVQASPTDLQALQNWQSARQKDPLFPHVRSAFAYVGFGSTFGPPNQLEAQTMTAMASDFGWINHGYTHGDPDCFTVTTSGTCIPATLEQGLSDIELNNAYGISIGLPVDFAGFLTPFNNGLGNQAYLQAVAWEGFTSVISANDPPSANTGAFSTLVPSLYLVPRRATNLIWDEDSPLTGVYGSLPDEYNADYGPNGTSPLFSQDQTYSQIIDNESTLLLQTRWMMYEPFPVGFHTSNSVAYDGVHSLMTDLFDATITKYENLFNLPVYTLATMRDITPVLLNRQTYNGSGVTGVYTPGISVVLTTVNAGTIPVTGACSQAVCPSYGGQIQDNIPMAAGSNITLSLTAGTGVGLSTMTVEPSSLPSGAPAQGLITLNGINSNNVLVQLSSNSPAAKVPGSVTIAAGDLGAPFTVTTAFVENPVTVTINATYNGVTRSVPLTINPAIALSKLSLSSATVAGGVSVTGTVKLTGVAPQNGINIPLLSNNAAATVPADVFVPAGSSSATFPVTTTAVTAATTGNILAVYNFITQTSPLTVTPATTIALTGVSVNPTIVVGGASSTGTVTLSAPASGNISVALSSSSSSAMVPASVTVSSGHSTATFTVTTRSVGASVTAIVSAGYKGTTETAALTITPVIAVTGLSLNPTSVPGGTASIGTVTLSGPVAGDTKVTLSSNKSSATVPSSVIVSSGESSATFTIATSKSVTASTTAIISAAYNGVARTASLTITPAAVTLTGLWMNPIIVQDGASSTGTVTLSGPASSDIKVALASNSSSATVPASVTVSAGKSSATFTLTTKRGTLFAIPTISAAYGGATKTTILIILP